MTTVITRGTQCITRASSNLYVREIKEDGTLGKEYKLPIGVLFTIRQIDFYRNGFIAEDEANKATFFVPFSADLETIYISKTDNHPVVNAIAFYNYGERDYREMSARISFIGLAFSVLTFIAGIFLGAVLVS